MNIPSIVNDDGWVNVDDLSQYVILYRKIFSDEAIDVAKRANGVRVISIIDVKGGVRKTTAAIYTAHNLHRETKKKVLIGDCDQYHSVKDWADQARKAGDPWPDDIVVVSASGDNFHHEILAAIERERPEYVVIDTPPNDRDAALRALLLADVMLTPTGPYPLDIRRLIYGIQIALMAQKLRGRPIQPLALITNCKMGTNLYTAARGHLETQGMSFLNMPIRDLVLHAQAFGTSVPKLGDYAFIAHDLVPILDKAKEQNS